MANILCKYLVGTFFKNFAPIIPPITLPKAVGISIFQGTSVLKIYISADIMERGSISAIAVAWLLCGGSERNFSIAGTAIVPPPLPKSPLAKPVKIPIKHERIFFKKLPPIYVESGLNMLFVLYLK